MTPHTNQILTTEYTEKMPSQENRKAIENIGSVQRTGEQFATATNAILRSKKVFLKDLLCKTVADGQPMAGQGSISMGIVSTESYQLGALCCLMNDKNPEKILKFSEIKYLGAENNNKDNNDDTKKTQAKPKTGRS